MRSFTQELYAINIITLFLQDYLKTVQYLQQDRLRDYGLTAFEKTDYIFVRAKTVRHDICKT